MCFLIVLQWLSSLAIMTDEGSIPFIPAPTLKEFFIRVGALKEPSAQALESLSKYTNAGKAPGMKEIWGERFAEFKQLADRSVVTYESQFGVLPALQPSGIKTSGMIALFGELTAYAYGAMDWETLNKYLSARLVNGYLWADGRKDERIRVQIPTADEPILLSSIQPGFTWVFGDWLVS